MEHTEVWYFVGKIYDTMRNDDGVGVGGNKSPVHKHMCANQVSLAQGYL